MPAHSSSQSGTLRCWPDRRSRGVSALPGVATASELVTAVGLGLSEVKFFNMTDYLAIPAVPAVSGSWMVAENLLAAVRWDEVTSRSRAAVTAARQTRGSFLTPV
jgi:2-dehydro-3-deoxyphosphogluconate aldolase/(4S)-4-hydroxy-2-oxoglutarate aldolase